MSVCLYQGDCLEIMPTLASGSVDLVLCDLPYGTTRNKWDSVLPLSVLWDEYQRIVKKDRAIVLNAAQPFTSQLVMSADAIFRQELIWHKNIASNFLNANRYHLNVHESILIFAFGHCPYYPQEKPGKPYVAKRQGTDVGTNYDQKNTTRTDTVNTGTRKPRTVLAFDRETGLHPTQKPVALMEYLIRTYTNPGDVVLDNCMGSGTTGVASVNTGRRFIGIEKDPNYFAIAQRRISEAQQTFTPDEQFEVEVPREAKTFNLFEEIRT